MIWTIDAEPGLGGRAIAGQLAAAAGVPLVDEEFTAAVAHDLGLSLDAACRYELPCPRAISCGITVGLAGRAYAELAVELRRFDLARRSLLRVATEAARSPCVIYGRCAHLPLASHPAAVHALLWAPFDWRVERARSTWCMSRAGVTRALRRADRRRRHFASWMTHASREEVTPTVTCDASRIRADRIVDMLLAAAGAPVASEEHLPELSVELSAV